MSSRTLLLTVLQCGLAFAQLDSNSVTVSATRSNTNVQPDQAILAVFVTTPLTASYNDVLAAVAPAGITGANFSGVGNSQGFIITTGNPSQQPPEPMLEWDFALPVPIAKIKDTAATLANLQKSIAQQKNGVALTFSVQGTQVSQALQQSQPCSIPDLLADARAQAQKLADAAGQSLGPILAMSSATSGNIGLPTVSVSRLGLTSSSFSIPFICSLTVKFGLTRY